MAEVKAISYGSAPGQAKAMPREVAYSLLSGFGYYVRGKGEVQVLGKSYSVYMHAQTGEEVYLVKAEGPYVLPSTLVDFSWEEFLAHWRDIILRPMPKQHFIWPVDLVERDFLYYLVFPLRNDLDGYRPIKELLPNHYNIDFSLLNSERRAAMHGGTGAAVASSLLSAWDAFASSSFLFFGLRDDALWYLPSSGNLVFCFSWSCLYDARAGSLARAAVPGGSDEAGRFACQRFPLWVQRPDEWHALFGLSSDYVDPWVGYPALKASPVDRGAPCVTTPFTELFSLAALLFRLYVGRLPYHGSIVAVDPPNSNPVEHEEWIDAYQKNAAFIFDSRDSSNHIGAFDSVEDEACEENWAALPPAAREAFTAVFAQDFSCDHPNPVYLTPAEWRGVLFEGKAFDSAARAAPEERRASVGPGESDAPAANESDATASKDLDASDKKKAVVKELADALSAFELQKREQEAGDGR